MVSRRENFYPLGDIASTGLNPSIRNQIQITLADVVPLWLSVTALDLRRVVRPSSPGSYSINIEQYKGAQSWINFRKQIENREKVKTLTDAIWAYQPELLGFISHPAISQFAQDVFALLGCWCAEVGKSIELGISVECSIDIVINAVDTFLAEKRAIYEVISLVGGLQIPDDLCEIVLSKDMVLRRLSVEELTEYASHDVTSMPRQNIMSRFVSTAILLIREVEVNLTTSFPEKYHDVNFHQGVQVQIQSVVSSLHLIKPGLVGIVASYTKLKPAVLPNMVGGSSFPVMFNPFNYMELNHDEVDEFAAIVKKVVANQREQIKIALARLVDAESRLSPVDSIIDAIIGLETLLNPNDYSELSFRVAINYAFLTHEPERRKRYETIRDIQKTRNRIVHGGLNLNSKDGLVIHEHSELAKIALRDAIKRFLNDEKLSGNAKLDGDFWLDRLLPPP